MYTPPLGNAVNFVFSTGGYSPPLGNAVAFVFGSAPVSLAYGQMLLCNI
jgi:hypothetical protein